MSFSADGHHPALVPPKATSHLHRHLAAHILFRHCTITLVELVVMSVSENNERAICEGSDLGGSNENKRENKQDGNESRRKKNMSREGGRMRRVRKAGKVKTEEKRSCKDKS